MCSNRPFNSIPPGQNGRHFADFFEHIFLNEYMKILIQISLKFLPKGPINNDSTLVEVMEWYQIGDKPLPKPLLTQFTDTYMGHWGGELKLLKMIMQNFKSVSDYTLLI